MQDEGENEEAHTQKKPNSKPDYRSNLVRRFHQKN